MTDITNEQLEAWAGLGPWRVHPGANSHLFDATIIDQNDSGLAFVHACLFEDEDNGVYGAALSQSGELMVASPDLAREVLRLRAEVVALQAFKDYVHERLDQAGIPTHPDGEHSKAGCRIGDRLDIALKIKGPNT